MTDTYKQDGGQVIWCSPACPKNSSRSTLLLLWGGRSRKVKVLDLFDLFEMSITIAGVRYLYPRLDYESWSNKTSYKLGKEDKRFLNYDNLDINLSFLWSLTFLLVPCLSDPVDRVYSLGMMTFSSSNPYRLGPPPWGDDIVLFDWWQLWLANPVEYFGFTLMDLDFRVLSSWTKIWCQHMPPNFGLKWFYSKILHDRWRVAHSF
jgi:hypothetical protein